MPDFDQKFNSNLKVTMSLYNLTMTNIILLMSPIASRKNGVLMKTNVLRLLQELLKTLYSKSNNVVKYAKVIPPRNTITFDPYVVHYSISTF